MNQILPPFPIHALQGPCAPPGGGGGRGGRGGAQAFAGNLVLLKISHTFIAWSRLICITTSLHECVSAV